MAGAYDSLNGIAVRRDAEGFRAERFVNSSLRRSLRRARDIFESIRSKPHQPDAQARFFHVRGVTIRSLIPHHPAFPGSALARAMRNCLIRIEFRHGNVQTVP